MICQYVTQNSLNEINIIIIYNPLSFLLKGFLYTDYCSLFFVCFGLTSAQILSRKHLVDGIQVMIGRFLMGRSQWDRELDPGHLGQSTRESGMVCISYSCTQVKTGHV